MQFSLHKTIKFKFNDFSGRFPFFAFKTIELSTVYFKQIQ